MGGDNIKKLDQDLLIVQLYNTIKRFQWGDNHGNNIDKYASVTEMKSQADTPAAYLVNQDQLDVQKTNGVLIEKYEKAYKKLVSIQKLKKGWKRKKRFQQSDYTSLYCSLAEAYRATSTNAKLEQSTVRVRETFTSIDFTAYDKFEFNQSGANIFEYCEVALKFKQDLMTLAENGALRYDKNKSKYNIGELTINIDDLKRFASIGLDIKNVLKNVLIKANDKIKNPTINRQNNLFLQSLSENTSTNQPQPKLPSFSSHCFVPINTDNDSNSNPDSTNKDRFIFKTAWYAHSKPVSQIMNSYLINEFNIDFLKEYVNPEIIYYLYSLDNISSATDILGFTAANEPLVLIGGAIKEGLKAQQFRSNYYFINPKYGTIVRCNSMTPVPNDIKTKPDIPAIETPITVYTLTK